MSLIHWGIYKAFNLLGYTTTWVFPFTLSIYVALQPCGRNMSHYRHKGGGQSCCTGCSQLTLANSFMAFCNGPSDSSVLCSALGSLSYPWSHLWLCQVWLDPLSFWLWFSPWSCKKLWPKITQFFAESDHRGHKQAWTPADSLSDLPAALVTSKLSAAETDFSLSPMSSPLMGRSLLLLLPH